MVIITFGFFVIFVVVYLLHYRVLQRWLGSVLFSFFFSVLRNFFAKFTVIFLMFLTRNQSIFRLLVLSVLIFCCNFNVVYCMEKEHMSQIIQACESMNNLMYSQEEIQALLTRVNSIQDPQILELLRQRIIIIAGTYNVDINTFLIPQLHHPSNADSNSGIPF
jgi:hypothetical protein